MTDPFINPEPNEPEPAPADLSIRAVPRRVSGLRPRAIQLAFASVAVVVAVALIVGLGIGRHQQPPAELRDVEPQPENLQPSPLAALPSSYADLPREAPPKPAVVRHTAEEETTAPTVKASETQKHDQAELLSSIQTVVRKNQEMAQQVADYQSQAIQAQSKLWASALFFKLDQPPLRQAAERSATADEPSNVPGNRATPPPVSAPAAGTSPPSSSPALPPATQQQRKLAFLNESPAPRMDIDRRPLSRAQSDAERGAYLLQAGAVVPAALLTGINTDLPGDVVATVTQNVFDSPTGNHLLVPQGARLYGSYDSQVAPSQSRALLVWHRLLLPDGRSMNLDRMRGTDGAGYAGLSDQVDYHADKLATAALLSGVIAYAGNLAGGRQGVTLTAGDVVGDAIAQQASSTGSKILQRELDVQPTITIRPGWPVRVLVNRDFVLPSYTD